MMRKIFRLFLIRFVYNRGISVKDLKHSPYAIFNDGAHNYALQTYYIKPIEQIKQLNEIGFLKDEKIYALNGREIKKDIDLKSNEDIWLYYLCVIK